MFGLLGAVAMNFHSLASTYINYVPFQFMTKAVTLAETGATGGMDDIISQLNTGLNSSTIFGTVSQLMPWVITLTIAALGLYFLRKLIKGASRGKVRF